MHLSRKVALVFIMLATRYAQAQFVVDHAPYPSGGSGSDTALPNSAAPFTWQQSADDFRVSAAATVTHVNWWGFHVEAIAPPTETMRIRLYAERANDSLPGEVLFDETFDNPERVDTGRRIGIVGQPHEYRYHAKLSVPMQLATESGYWLEIAQLGDRDSGFLWELSLADRSPYSYSNNVTADWRRSTGTADLAFQLVVSEPVTAGMLLLGLVFAAGLRARGRLNSW